MFISSPRLWEHGYSWHCMRARKSIRGKGFDSCLNPYRPFVLVINACTNVYLYWSLSYHTIRPPRSKQKNTKNIRQNYNEKKIQALAAQSCLTFQKPGLINQRQETVKSSSYKTKRKKYMSRLLLIFIHTISLASPRNSLIQISEKYRKAMC